MRLICWLIRETVVGSSAGLAVRRRPYRQVVLGFGCPLQDSEHQSNTTSERVANLARIVASDLASVVMA